MLIVGNGLIAKQFKKNISKEEVIVIAAGVSNSLNTDKREFEREMTLIRETLDNFRGDRLLYFSTCSVVQNHKTPYIQHKLDIERVLLDSNTNTAIFRLPQVVGVVNNNTIVSSFVRSMMQNKEITIQKNAYRYLIDVADITRIVDNLISNEGFVYNKIYNLSSTKQVSAIEIALKIKDLINTNSTIRLIDGGEKYNIDSSEIKNIIGENDVIFGENYPFQLLEKYVNLIVNAFISS